MLCTLVQGFIFYPLREILYFPTKRIQYWFVVIRPLNTNFLENRTLKIGFKRNWDSI